MSPELRKLVLGTFRKEKIPYAYLWNGHVSSLVPRSLPKNVYRLPSQFLDALFIFDLLSCLVQQLKFACLFATFQHGESGANTDQDNCIMTLIGRIESDLAAIRTLVLTGSDVQARSLSRGLSEHLDALALSGINPIFCTDFVTHQDGQAANGMWLRHMAKGRARKQIYKAVDDSSVGIPVTDWFKLYRAQEEEMLASAVHPTHIAGFMSVVPHISDPTIEGWGNEKHVSGASRRTLRFCSIRCVETILFDARVYGVVSRIKNRLPNKLRGIDLSGLIKSTDCVERVAIELLKYMFQQPGSNSGDEAAKWEGRE